MFTRRQFAKISLAALAAGIVNRVTAQPVLDQPYAVALPLVIAPQAAATPTPTTTPSPTPTATPTSTPTATPVPAGDAPILGSATGSVDQMVAWLGKWADSSYSSYDLQAITIAYQQLGEKVGIDWFTAMAQMAHETANLTSFWSLRPQRNPAGIGVTGQWSATQPADLTNWAYNTQRNRWEVGISFPTWADHAIPAHLGRLLAYAITDDQATQAQLDMIQFALSYRGILAANRGIAPTWIGLNGRWAVPGTTYGQTILALAAQIRSGL